MTWSPAKAHEFIQTLVVALFERSRNKCHASNRCLTSNKKLVVTSATLVVTGALLVVTRS